MMLERLGQNRHKRKCSNNRGFILMDIVLGIFIITIALVGLATAFRQSTMVVIDLRSRTEALGYAQKAMENLKQYDGRATFDETPPSTEIHAEEVIPGTSFSSSVSKGSVVYDKMVPVTVTVFWNEPTTGSATVKQSIQLVGYLYFNP